MNTVTVARKLDAPQQAVWDLLADFPNIADWNSGVTKSFSTSSEPLGVGATRHCDLKPVGGLEETMREIDAPNRAVISIDSATKLPLKKGLAEFILKPEGNGTHFTLNYSFEARGGPFAPFVAKMLEGQFKKGFGGFLDDIEAEAQARSTT